MSLPVTPITLLVNELSIVDAGTIRTSLLEKGFVEDHTETGLVMQSIIDTFDVPFHLGEVLVTQSWVTRGTVRGWAMVMGDNPARAFIAAAVDAANRSGDRHLQEYVPSLEAPLYVAREKRLAEEQNLTKSTKVNFGLMVEG